MDSLYSLALLYFLIASAFSTHQFMLFYWKTDDDSARRRSFMRKLAAAATVVVVAFAYYVQDRHRHEYSREARAMEEFDKLLDAWGAGSRGYVIGELNHLSTTIRPWEQHREEYAD